MKRLPGDCSADEKSIMGKHMILNLNSVAAGGGILSQGWLRMILTSVSPYHTHTHTHTHTYTHTHTHTHMTIF